MSALHADLFDDDFLFHEEIFGPERRSQQIGEHVGGGGGRIPATPRRGRRCAPRWCRRCTLAPISSKRRFTSSPENLSSPLNAMCSRK